MELRTTESAKNSMVTAIFRTSCLLLNILFVYSSLTIITPLLFSWYCCTVRDCGKLPENEDDDEHYYLHLRSTAVLRYESLNDT